MINRMLMAPTGSFLLFGARGTGKSTWLREVFRPDVSFDLLRSENFLMLTASPGQLRHRLESFPQGTRPTKVVIDEVQRIPQLLNEVHALIEDFPGRFKFALTGSSARKLRSSEANLLAGRAVTRFMFPLVKGEYDGLIAIDDCLAFGSLPRLVGLDAGVDKIDFLRSYSQTYLQEEIQQQALVRNLPNYVRFLRHLAVSNGRPLNLSSLSREAGIQRAPLENYMSILQDTLMGIQVEPLHLRAKVKEVSTAKFYFFDCGVVEALTGNLGTAMTPDRSGHLFETMVLGELRAHAAYSGLFYDVMYWGTASGNEVDFVLAKGSQLVGIEVKSSTTWRPEFAKGLNVLLDAKKIKRGIVVFRGTARERHKQIDLLPFADFCQELYRGDLIS